MSGLRTYSRVFVRVRSEMCVVEEERRDGALANDDDYDTGDLEPLNGNNATSQCDSSNKLLVAVAFKVTCISLCIGKCA
jgi:hypothetical protein|tara:strand:- start:25333 stop:25569 length:237 start_codon:yes stop_codon:yes gene_type:complete